METQEIKLTQWNEGSGCGCKIAPAVLEQILAGSKTFQQPDKNLLVGNDQKDDAAVYRISPDLAIINTVDFFTPIVNDPFDFGRIAAANALSDVYAMGGKPLFANAILSWPVEKLSPDLAAKVMEGAKSICAEAGVIIAGGHSIAAKDPIFGLSVSGTVHPDLIKTNSGAKAGDLLYITKPLGIGVLATALKREKITTAHYEKLILHTCHLNQIGENIGTQTYIHALTDVTGFGLLGHLTEMCLGSGLTAEIDNQDIPLIEGVKAYIDQFIFPDNTYRNWNAYSSQILGVNGMDLVKLCDPQTSGGLLMAVDAGEKITFEQFMKTKGEQFYLIGRFKEQQEKAVILQ